jgi:hypothetical protein
MTRTHEFNLTGAARKPLIEAIEGFTKVKGVYQGAPKFGYAFYGIGILDKAGTLEFYSDCDLQVIMDLVTHLEQSGFPCNTTPSPSDCPENAAWYDECDREDRDEFGNWDGDPTPHYLRNLPKPLNLSDVETADDNVEDNTLAIEIPLKDFSQAALDNLGKLIESKRELIKAAIGHDTVLPVIPTADNKLRFEWFPYTTDGEEVTAYAQLISLMCKTAREKKRITAKPQEKVSNPKFSFRVWLISLGMVGDDYKTSRKILLRNLSGNSAFAGGKMPEYTAHCYTYPNGSEEDAMDCESYTFPSQAKAKVCCDEFLQDCESIKFAGAHVEDEDGKYVYEILLDGTVESK